MSDRTDDRPKLPLSACVVALDEEANLPRCLASLAFCDDVVVVDSHSTDRTREIAAEMGARVFERDWPGFGEQKNFAAGEAKHDWILSLDADEWLSDELAEEIRALVERGLDGPAGYTMPRLSNYLGTWMRRGGWYPDRQLRLYDRRKGRWGGRPPHEHVELDGEPGTLRGRLLHVPYETLDAHLDVIDRYTTTMAQEMHAEGKRASVLDLVLRPSWRFLRFYLVKGAFVHGWVGLHLAYLDAHYVRMKYAKLRAMQEDLPVTETSDAALPATLRVDLVVAKCHDINDGGLNGQTDHIKFSQSNGLNTSREFDLGDFRHGTSKSLQIRLYPRTPGNPGPTGFFAREIDSGPDDQIGGFWLEALGVLRPINEKTRVLERPPGSPWGRWKLKMTDSGADYDFTFETRLVTRP